MANYYTSSDFSKLPKSTKDYMDMRGVVDFGNLMQFAPYESGYCFIAVIAAPACMKYTEQNKELQERFVNIIEQEFKGLDGIDDISSETMDITDNISTLQLISKVNQTTASQISMKFTEKSGAPITKYISSYLRCIKDTKTQGKTYGGYITADNVDTVNPGPEKEVFTMLYIVTDNTCLRIEKAFLLLNAQPTNAEYSDLYNVEKGDISSKEITVPFNAFVVDGTLPNKIALAYMRSIITNSETYVPGKINLNSYGYNWSYTDNDGIIKKIDELDLKIVTDPGTGKSRTILSADPAASGEQSFDITQWGGPTEKGSGIKWK